MTFLAVGTVIASILALPRPAAAHEAPTCPETWNPSREPDKFTGVPGGWSTAPGTTNPSTPQNPDGFFTLLSADGHALNLFNGCPVGFGGIDDGGDPTELIATFPSGTTVKFTEANGKEPGFKEMAGGSPQSDYIDYHVWAQGDLYICDVFDSNACTCCFVPPPPFTPAQ